MNTLILAAGYATRMGSIALDRPKALLPVGGRPVLDRLVESLRAVPGMDRISLVTNHKFAAHFLKWSADHPEWDVRILDDGTVSNETRLGAIADLRFAIEREVAGDNLMVVASDNIFMLSLPRLAAFFAEHGADCITVHREDDVAKLRKTGVVEMDADGRVTAFEEKPAAPRSNYACPPLYLFTRETLSLVSEYLQTGANPDAPGHFIAWLAGRRPLYAFRFEEPRYSIGDEQSYRDACRVFSDPSA